MFQDHSQACFHESQNKTACGVSSVSLFPINKQKEKEIFSENLVIIKQFLQYITKLWEIKVSFS